MHTSTNPFITDPIKTTTSSQKTSPISPIKMYPANAYLNEKRSPSPTFVNITSPFDYPTPTKSHLPINHHPTSLKFAKTRDLIPKSNQSSPIPRDQTELLFPDDAYRIEFCMPSNHVICKCPPTSADILFHHQQQQQQHLQNHQHHHSNTTKSRRKTKSKNEISNHQHRWRTKKCPEIPITSNCQEIINIENYCAPTNSSQTPTAAMLHHHAATMRNHHHPPPPVYDVYSYAYLEPPPPQPPTLQQQQQFQTQKSSSPVTCLPPPIPSTSFANQPPPLYDSRGPSTSSGSTSSSTSQHGKTPSRSSIKALLAKGFRSRANGLSANSLIRSRSISANGAGGSINGVGCNGNGNPMDKYTYTTRYGTTENLYEEVNEEKIREILSADGLDIQSPAGSPGHTMITPPPQPISSKEEQRRVQNTHFRILDELNLSLEALIMPPTPPECSPTEEDPNDSGNSGGLNVSKSVENISSTLKSLDLKSNNNDVDSGYSVSSGSNITSLFYKDNFKFGKKIMASAKRSATMSAKKSNSQQSKGFNEHSSIAMTLISPSSPFKSMKKLFDTSQVQKTTIVDDDNIVGNCGNGGSALGIGGGSMRMKNKFWTIKQW